MRTASPIEEAWNPMWFMPLMRSSTVMGRPVKALKSSSSTFWDPAGIEPWTRTASVTEDGTAALVLEGGVDSAIVLRWLFESL